MQKTCGRLSPAVRLYAANFTVRVITMCQRDTSDHDGQPEKTRRCARGLVGRRHLVRQRTAKPLDAGEALPGCLSCSESAAAPRAQSYGFDAWEQAFVDQYAVDAKNPALVRPTLRNPTISTDSL